MSILKIEIFLSTSLELPVNWFYTLSLSGKQRERKKSKSDDTRAFTDPMLLEMEFYANWKKKFDRAKLEDLSERARTEKWE